MFCRQASLKTLKYLLINQFLKIFRYATSNDNPFSEQGILSKKADFIINRSTITRTSLQIVDPDKLDDSFLEVKDEDSNSAIIKKSLKPQLDFGTSIGDGEIIRVDKTEYLPQKPMDDAKTKVKKNKHCCNLS